jgi:protein SCO1/2
MIRQAIILGLLLCSLNLQAHNLQPIDPDSPVIDESMQQAAFSASFPDIDLVDHRNQTVALNSLFESDKNVVFAFFFSHCVSVCTTITMSLKSLQQDLPADTLIAMISIDPETDTPELLSSYAQKFQIDDSNWYLLTGENREIVALQKEFAAYRGNKMNHTTSLFVKKPGSKEITEFKNNFSDISGFLKTS